MSFRRNRDAKLRQLAAAQEEASLIEHLRTIAILESLHGIEPHISIIRHSTRISQPVLEGRQAIPFKDDVGESINQNDEQALGPLVKKSNENKTQSDKKQVAGTQSKKKIVEDKTESKSINNGKKSTGAVPKKLNKNKKEPDSNQGENQPFQKNTTCENNKDSDLNQGEKKPLQKNTTCESNKDSDSSQNQNSTSSGISTVLDEEKNTKIIEKIIKCLEKDKSKEFLFMLETVLSADSMKDSKSRNISFELIWDLLDNIQHCEDEKELLALKQKLTGALVPRELLPFTLSVDSMDTVCVLKRGAFGLTLKAELVTKENKKIDAVIKSPLAEAFNPMLIQEAVVLSKQNHKNVVSMLGILNGKLFGIVMEYMDLGNLIDACKAVNFTNLNLFNILVEVATGMEYIAQQKYVHRDLASRNVLINSKRQVKISDFGLCRYVGDTDGVYEEKGKALDSYNMAPEYVMTNLYTTECDVWSMGVLCQELFQISTLNYSNFFISLSFHRHQKPKRCPGTLYNFITVGCMNIVAKNRPSFTAIKTKLLKMIENEDYK